jgi:hypothetical protein
MRRLATALAVAVAALTAFAAPASAHATFVGPTSYPTGADQHLTLEVPHERSDGPFNVDVAVYLPATWQAQACDAVAPWSCTIGVGDGRPLLRWIKDAAAGPTSNDETFSFAARTGPPGLAAFPVIQTYSTGEEVRWIGSPGAGEPAPTLQIVAASAAPSTSSTSAGPTMPTSSGGSGISNPGGQSTSTTSLAVGATGTSGPAVGSTSTVPTSTVAPQDLAVSDTDTKGSGGGSGGSLAWLAVAVLCGAVLVGTGGLGVVALRRRRSAQRGSEVLGGPGRAVLPSDDETEA